MVDANAEEAVKFYAPVLKNSKVEIVTHLHGKKSRGTQRVMNAIMQMDEPDPATMKRA